MAYDYDMVVIGGGAAGLTAAGMSALLGAKTALVEQHRLGGECTWTGCIPSKTLLKAAHTAHTMRTAGRFGLTPVNPEVDFGRVMEHVRSVRQGIYEDTDAPPHFEKMAVEVIAARAQFTGSHSLELSNGRQITSRRFLIATGARPRALNFPCLNNETLFELTERPSRLLVLGAGPVAIEMSQAFARLGSTVTVVAPEAAILQRDDAELAQTLRTRLESEGIHFRLGRRAESGAPAALLDNGETIECDAVLAAIGRVANVDDLGLERAGVEFSPAGIAVDQHCRTSQRHIYASGDVTGRYQFTHMAEHMSKVAVTNAILRVPQSLDDAHVTWCTFTDPELAQVGATEAALLRAGVKHTVYRFPYSKLDRAITDSASGTGLIKVMASPRGRILGVSILGVCAGEMIAEWAVAMRGGLGLSQISSTIHPYPTYALGNRRAADLRALKQLDSPLLGWLGKLLSYRGERRGSAAL